MKTYKAENIDNELVRLENWIRDKKFEAKEAQLTAVRLQAEVDTMIWLQLRFKMHLEETTAEGV